MLYPHQTTGAAWLAARRHACLFDEQGLGKTITAITAADLCGATSVLVVCPTVVLWNWKREIESWSPWRDVCLLDTIDAAIDPTCDTVVVTHGLTIRHAIRSQLLTRHWDLIVLDEAHFFRTRTTKRTRAFFGGEICGGAGSLIKHAERVWLLTGTPLPNDVSEIWVFLRALFPECISRDDTPLDFDAFRERYCRTKFTRYGVKVIGNRNVSELRARIAGTYLRRLKKDHLDLPPIRFEQVTLRPAKLPTELKTLNGELSAKVIKAIGESDDVASGFRKLKAIFGQPSRWRRLCGLAKVEPAIELLSMELEEGGLRKVVVFCHHTAVVAALTAGLAHFGVVTITGNTPAKDRASAVVKFQESTPRVAVCQIVAGGTGITLTAATDVVFVEMSFVPGENAQAANRCHRIGQTERVRVRFIALADTVDEPLTSVLRRKTAMIREVIK